MLDVQAQTPSAPLPRLLPFACHALVPSGQSIKVFSQLLRKARSKGLIIPNMDKQKRAAGGGAEDGVAYEGATVLEPKIGERARPLCTWQRALWERGCALHMAQPQELRHD